MNTIRRTMLGACCVTACISVAAFVWSMPVDTVEGSVGDAPAERGVILTSQLSPDLVHPLPAVTRVRRHDAAHPGETRDVSAFEGTPEKVIYSNTLGAGYFNPRAGIRIADDIFTEAVTDCEMTRFLVRVTGGVEDGDGQFDVTVALFEQCPSVQTWNAAAIPGTELKFTGLFDNLGDINELVIDYNDPNLGICDNGKACRISMQDCDDESTCVQGPPVVIPPSVYLRLEFSTDHAGWVIGAPAIRGFSADQFDHLFTGCNSWFGGFPFFWHSSFYSEIFAVDTCETHHLAYMAMDPLVDAFDPPGGTLNPLADDLQLIENRCELSALEIGTKGTSGKYEINFDLRNHPEFDPIPGTPRSFASRDDGGKGELAVARFLFDEGLFLDQNIWLIWQADKPKTGLPNVQRNQAGSSRDVYAMFNHPANPGEWAEYTTPDNKDAVFYAAVYCRGPAPMGACCPDQVDLPGQPVYCFDDVSVLSCLGARWLNGATCPEGHGDPNDPWAVRGFPACGTQVCCMPNNNCANLSRDDCDATVDEQGRPSFWFRGRFCGEQGQRCPFFSCFYAKEDCAQGWDPFMACNADGPCLEMHPDSFCQFPERTCWVPKGCSNVSCCDWVCRGQTFCCDIAWDFQCAAAAADCPGAPGNDDCWDPQPGLGAFDITIEEVGEGQWFGSIETSHADATLSLDDPGFCCNNRGVDRTAVATVWYKFVAPETGTARIHTCNSAGAENAQDSLVQVFRVPNADLGRCDDQTQCSVAAQDCADLSECLFDEQTVCENLEVFACNDDGPDGCGSGSIDGNSDVCIPVNANTLYYVVVGAGSTAQTGVYRLNIDMPCDDPQPDSSFCVSSVNAPSPPGLPNGPFSVPFDLAFTSIDCPGEPCVETMKNDVWFEHQANCTGRLRVETCGALPEDPDPDTTLAVYHGETCPPGEPLGCNDDAAISAASLELRDQWCEVALNECETDDDCGKVCNVNLNPCSRDVECDVGDCEDGSACSFLAQDCRDFTVCVRNEICVDDECISECGHSSSVTIPVIVSEVYKIRLGGFLGGTPSGSLTIECIPEDCNFNGLPDILDIETGRSLDCNFNEKPDECDINIDGLADCQLNGIPDECELFIGNGVCEGWCLPPCAEDDNLNCIPDECEVTGACCREGWPCEVTNPVACGNIGGTYMGDDTTCIPNPCVAADVNLTSGTPAHEGTLWRSKKNIARLTFDGDLPPAPTAGQVEIVELLDGGVFGPDLSASFSMTVEGGTILRVQDTDANGILQHRSWYAIRNLGGWTGVAPFQVDYLVQMGDCDGNGIVISLDVGCVNAGIPCFVNCGDDNRKDIDGDGRVISLDVGVVNGHIGSFGVPKPAGHP